MSTPPGPVRVLVVDDSALARRIITRQLESAPGIAVVGTAGSALEARDCVLELSPDVITLDVQMPGADGLVFLRSLMAQRPTRVVMVSAFTREGAATALEALEEGAFDVVAKPSAGGSLDMARMGEELVDKVRAAAASPVPAARPRVHAGPAGSHPISELSRSRLVVIGASTGGPAAIRTVLEGLPADGPGVVVVQHMPAQFTRSFAERCDRTCPQAVREAADGDEVASGTVLIAPGGRHLELARTGIRRWCVRLSDAPPVNRHRPSVDVLFASAVAHAGPHAAGVLLTGMGDDGAEGLAAMRRAGSLTIAEHRSTALVYGMPAEAVARDAAVHVLPLPRIAPLLDAWARGLDALPRAR